MLSEYYAEARVAIAGYKLRLLKTPSDTWQLFSEKFVALWDQNWGSGDAYKKEVYNSKEVQSLVQKAYMSELFQNALGFAAAKMIRRIVGIAHVEDLESITDVQKKVTCERRALNSCSKRGPSTQTLGKCVTHCWAVDENRSSQ